MLYNTAVASSEPSESDRRFGARLRTDLWITVRGVELEPRLVNGDISASGVYFRIDHSLGVVGSILALELATEDRVHMVEVMAHLVREVRCNDLYHGETVSGVAFGFLLQSSEQQEDLQLFLRAIYRQQQDLQLDVGMAARVEQPSVVPRRDATVRILSLDGMVIETDWEVEAGESLEVEVTAPASRTVVRVAGQVVSCQRSIHHDGTVQYSIQMQFAGAEAVAPPTGYRPLEPLLEEMAIPAGRDMASATRHLRGTLDQVGLTSLLSFLELERRSCCLSVHQDHRSVGILVRQGQVIDVQAPGQHPPRELLEELLFAGQGEFELAFQDVEGPDRLGVTTTTLLLEAACRHDEQKR